VTWRTRGASGATRSGRHRRRFGRTASSRSSPQNTRPRRVVGEHPNNSGSPVAADGPRIESDLLL